MKDQLKGILIGVATVGFWFIFMLGCIFLVVTLQDYLDSRPKPPCDKPTCTMSGEIADPACMRAMDSCMARLAQLQDRMATHCTCRVINTNDE
jgi:hypothetical protein